MCTHVARMLPSTSWMLWIFRFLTCFILLIASSVCQPGPGVRTLLTKRGLNFVRKLAMPVITKKLNNLEISPISGNVDFFIGYLNYKFKNITVSEVKIPESDISVLSGTGLFVKGTKITIKVNELWNYELTSWPFLSDKGSAVISGNQISLNIILQVSKGTLDKPSITAKDCNLNIGNLDIEFRGGASSVYNFFITFVKDQLKNQLEEVICENAIKAVNQKINSTLKTIPDEVLIADNTMKTNYVLVRPTQYLHHGIENDFKGEFLNCENPKRPPYTPEDLPPTKDENIKMLYLWITAYTFDTIFFAINQNESQYMFYSKDLPDSVPVQLNTNYFMFIVPPLYQKYPDKEMVIGYVNYAPAKVTFKPDDGSITTFRKMTFYVLQDENKLVDCFTLNVVEVAKVDEILTFQKDNYSYIGLKISSSRTDVTLLETHIGNFDVSLIQFTIDVLFQFVITRYISPTMEKGFQLPLPKNVLITNSDTVIGKNYILISTDFEVNQL